MGGAKKQFHSRSGNLYEFEFGIAKSYCSHIQEIGRELLHLASMGHQRRINSICSMAGAKKPIQSFPTNESHVAIHILSGMGV